MPRPRWGGGPGALLLSFCALLLVSTIVRADAIDDALRCLEDDGGRDARREVFLQQADSVGRVVEKLQAEGREAPEELLRLGEKIQRRAMEEGLAAVADRMRCHQAMEKGLAACNERISRLEARIRQGKGDRESAEELLRLQNSRTRLQTRLAGPVTLSYRLLPVDSTDTQDVLRGKLQYYRDILDYLEKTQRRVNGRLGQVEEERRTLAEAQRFLRDLDFLGEGGRALPSNPLRGSGPAGVDPGTGEQAGMARAGSDSAEGSLASRDLELVLSLTPVTPEQSDRLIQVLRQYEDEIKREAEAVKSEIARLEERILPVDEPR